MKLRPRLTFANVVSCLALFVALGGASAFAATQLAKNSVGTSQLKNAAVTTAKVKDGSLLAGDFAPGQLPAGKDGAPGAPGAPGKPGEKGEAGTSTESAGYWTRQGGFETGEITEVGENRNEIVALALPAGKYLISATGGVGLYNVVVPGPPFEYSAFPTVVCELNAGSSNIAYTLVRLFPTGADVKLGVSGNQDLALQGGIELQQSSTVKLLCGRTGEEGKAEVDQATISAQRVESLTQQ